MPPYDTRFGLSQSVADYLNQGLPSISNVYSNNIAAPIANPIMQNTQPNFMGLTPEQLQLLRLQNNLGNQGQQNDAPFAANPEVTGIFSLKNFLQNIPTPMNLARRGLDSLRGYLGERRQQSDDAAARTMAQARGLQKQIDQRPSATNGGRSGGGQDMGSTRSKDLGSMRGGVGR